MEFSSVYPSVNLLVIKKYYYRGIYQRNEVGNLFLRVCLVSKSVGNNIFLLPMDLPIDKKLPMKDSPTEHFRR
jgi:hypothetical protein